jgi:hypothetical protein
MDIGVAFSVNAKDFYISLRACRTDLDQKTPNSFLLNRFLLPNVEFEFTEILPRLLTIS